MLFLLATTETLTPHHTGFFVDSQPSIGGTVSRCYLTALSSVNVNAGSEWAGSPVCDAHHELSAQLARTIASLTVRPRYLFLANEPCVATSCCSMCLV